MRTLKNPALAISNAFQLITTNRSSAFIDTFLVSCLQNLELRASQAMKFLLSYRKSNILNKYLSQGNPEKLLFKNAQHQKSNRSSLQLKSQPRLIKTLPAEKYNTIKPVSAQDGYDLSGQSVLCIGGHISLYAEYEQLAQKMGARFMSFHGAPDDTPIERLLQLLEKTDMIVCPIDCINHQVFIIVKCYCQLSEKPCVLLDRSTLTAFQQGIHTLANWANGFSDLAQKKMVNLSS